MRFTFTADWHLSGYNQDKVDANTNFPERLSGIRSVIIEMIEYSLKNEIKYMIVGGDIFHNKSIIYSVAQSVLLDIIRVYKNGDITFIILPGNHDMSNMTGTGVSATKCLDHEPNVKTIRRTTKIENILLVPWNPIEMIPDIKEGNTDYLIAHLGLNEGSLNSGISIVSDIGLKDLKQYKRVLLGHYHKPQEIGNTIYVGSPLSLDWGEKNEEKRFLIVDTDHHTIESIPTVDYKKYYEFKINSENQKDIIEKVKLLQNEGHHIKLIRTDDSDLTEAENEIQTISIIDKREKDITNRGITSGMSGVDKLMRYLEIKEIPEEKKEKYKNVGLDIMNSIG